MGKREDGRGENRREYRGGGTIEEGGTIGGR